MQNMSCNTHTHICVSFFSSLPHRRISSCPRLCQRTSVPWSPSPTSSGSRRRLRCLRTSTRWRCRPSRPSPSTRRPTQSSSTTTTTTSRPAVGGKKSLRKKNERILAGNSNLRKNSRRKIITTSREMGTHSKRTQPRRL